MALDAIRQDLKTLLNTQDLAVLCTQGDGQPYASLVGFAVSGDLKKAWFATPRETRKYANLTTDPRVALLIDNRRHHVVDFEEASACTIMGKVRELDGQERTEAMVKYVEKLPQLADFVQAPNSVLFEVQIRQYVMVSHFQQVTEFHP